MKKYLTIFLLTLSLTAGAADIIYLPTEEGFFAKILRCKFYLSCYRQNLGVTLTTINATDLISNSRAVINTNFTNLNNGKIENSTTTISTITTLNQLATAGSLATVGTITSGTWNGSAIGVLYGGTGSTTAPANYHVILGDRAGGFLTVASSTGTSGQFLTSNGASAYPSWQTPTVNQNIDYTWQGSHWFKASTTISGTLSLNASTTVNNLPVGKNKLLTAPASILLSNASTTIFNVSIPANSLADGGIIRVMVSATTSGMGVGDHNWALALGFGSGSGMGLTGTTTCGLRHDDGGSSTSTINFIIRAISTSKATLQCSQTFTSNGGTRVLEHNSLAQVIAGNALDGSKDESSVTSSIDLSVVRNLFLEGLSSTIGLTNIYNISAELLNP